MNVMDGILSRRSWRSYTDQPVTQAELDTILQAAYAAPNADSAYEDMELTVVKSVAAKNDILEIYRKGMGKEQSDPLYGAPVFIIISTKVPENDPVGYANAACMVENMSLAATELGLGQVYIYGMFDDLRLKHNHVLDTYLGLTDGKTAISGIVVGHVSEPLTKRTKPKGYIKTTYL